jgi:hypothetical protein
MTKQDQINFIREKCIEANPEIARHTICGSITCTLFEHVVPANVPPTIYAAGDIGRGVQQNCG